MVKRITLNFIVDFVSFVNLLGLTFTGLIMKYVLPAGSGGQGRGFRGGRGPGQIREFWSMSRHEWGDLHFYLSIVFVVLIVLHVILHWGWIENYIRRLFGVSRERPVPGEGL